MSQRRALGVLFAALAAGLGAVAVAAGMAGGGAWVIAAAAAGIAVWLGSLSVQAFRRRR